MQMLIASRRADASTRRGEKHCGAGALLDRFLKLLPFELTAAQSKVIGEIRHDLAANHPMNRLLQGDVGSGKTVVAIAGMLLAVESGYQAAFMAPTQILAEQHYDVLRRWLEPLGVRMALRTAARQEESGPLPLFERVQESPRERDPGSTGCQPVVSGSLPDTQTRAIERPGGRLCSPDERLITTNEPQILIGTHALLYDKVSFSNLGLVVIDEQHKFGVTQRALLSAREPAPDVLVMTATPIPRTLTMTIYGDLDVSTIDEMPRNRGKIVTAVRDGSKLGEILAFLRTQLEAGRQVYVIYPLIDESEKLDAKAAAAEYEFVAGTFASVSLRSASRSNSGAGETRDHGTFSPRRDEHVDQHHRA